MTVKELKDLLNSNNVLDNAEINIDIQDGDFGEGFVFRDIDVYFTQGSVPVVSIIGSPKKDTLIESCSNYANVKTNWWDEDEFVFDENGAWTSNGKYDRNGKKGR